MDTLIRDGTGTKDSDTRSLIIRFSQGLYFEKEVLGKGRREDSNFSKDGTKMYSQSTTGTSEKCDSAGNGTIFHGEDFGWNCEQKGKSC